MYHIKQTDTFADWLSGLRDNKAKARIISRMDFARLGNLGDCKSVGAGIREMRIHVGPGYRVYYIEQRKLVIFLLCGGSKSSQTKDIERDKQLALEMEE